MRIILQAECACSSSSNSENLTDHVKLANLLVRHEWCLKGKEKNIVWFSPWRWDQIFLQTHYSKDTKLPTATRQQTRPAKLAGSLQQNDWSTVYKMINESFLSWSVKERSLWPHKEQCWSCTFKVRPPLFNCKFERTGWNIYVTGSRLVFFFFFCNSVSVAIINSKITTHLVILLFI